MIAVGLERRNVSQTRRGAEEGWGGAGGASRSASNYVGQSPGDTPSMRPPHSSWRRAPRPARTRCPNYAASCSNNNGNIWQQSMQRAGGTWNQTYAYGDGVNRLTGVSETGPATGWTETYGYDFYGNRWVASTTEQTLTAETPQGSAWYLTTNRISGWGYDGAGNVTAVAKTVREFCRMNHLAITRSTPFSRRQESPIVVQSGLWLVRAVKCTIRRIIMEAS